MAGFQRAFFVFTESDIFAMKGLKPPPLECAEVASADYLVTGNKRHFPKRWKVTAVVNARELLGLIGANFLK